MRDGMTLLETVLALALLTALFTGSAWWLREAAALRVTAASPLRFEQASRALLDRIGDDLLVGDFTSSEPRREPRVRIVEGMLTIRTRDHGLATRAYGFDRNRGEVFEETRAPGAGAGVSARSVLLGDVKEFVVSIEPRTAFLHVAIHPPSAPVVRRSWSIP